LVFDDERLELFDEHPMHVNKIGSKEAQTRALVDLREPDVEGAQHRCGNRDVWR